MNWEIIGRIIAGALLIGRAVLAVLHRDLGHLHSRDIVLTPGLMVILTVFSVSALSSWVAPASPFTKWLDENLGITMLFGYITVMIAIFFALAWYGLKEKIVLSKDPATFEVEPNG